MVSFAFKNLSQSPISSIKFTIPGTLSVNPISQMNVPFVLSAGETNSFNLFFEITNFQQAQKVSGSIEYSVIFLIFQKKKILFLFTFYSFFSLAWSPRL